VNRTLLYFYDRTNKVNAYGITGLQLASDPSQAMELRWCWAYSPL